MQDDKISSKGLKTAEWAFMAVIIGILSVWRVGILFKVPMSFVG